MKPTFKSNLENGTHGKTQIFTFTAPSATSVQLVGDFTQWRRHPINLHRESGGLWRTAVALDPGEHHYRFLVDGQWRDDPDCSVRVPNPFGSQDSVRQA